MNEDLIFNIIPGKKTTNESSVDLNVEVGEEWEVEQAVARDQQAANLQKELIISNQLRKVLWR